MKTEIPETVILDMQKKAYERKDELVKIKEIAAKKKKEWEDAERDVWYAEKCLIETADFLQTYNSDACDGDETWRGILGVDLT